MVHVLLSMACLGGVLLAGCYESTNQENLEPKSITTQTQTENRVAGQYIVILKEGGSQATLVEVFKPYGIKSIRVLSKGRYIITLEQDPGPADISSTAATSEEIESVQPDYIYRATQPAQ